MFLLSWHDSGKNIHPFGSWWVWPCNSQCAVAVCPATCRWHSGLGVVVQPWRRTSTADIIYGIFFPCKHEDLFKESLKKHSLVWTHSNQDQFNQQSCSRFFRRNCDQNLAVILLASCIISFFAHLSKSESVLFWIFKDQIINTYSSIPNTCLVRNSCFFYIITVFYWLTCSRGKSLAQRISAGRQTSLSVTWNDT